jgi:hypothetical protein
MNMGTELAITEEERKTCVDAAQLIWRHGAHNPQDAVVAFNFTKLVERLMTADKAAAPPEFKKVD